MSQFLPPNLLALFVAREMPAYMPPLDKLTHEKKRQAYTGLADFMKFFEVSIKSAVLTVDSLEEIYAAI